MAKFYYSKACFCLSCKMSNYVGRVPRMSILKSSRRLPISICIMPPLLMGYQWPIPVRILPREHLIHK